MNQQVKLSKAIKILILICAALVFVAIWPADIIQEKYVSKSNEIFAMESDPVNVERNVTQMFVGEGGELSAVDLYVCNDMQGETITFRLYDAGYNEIFNNFHVVKDNQEFPGFVHIPVGYDLVKDQEYYFTLEGLTADMTVAYEARETSTSIVNGFMSYGGVEIQRYNVIIRYEYSNPFVWWKVVIFGLAIAAAASALVWCVSRLFEKKFTDRDIKVHTIFKVVLNPLVIIAGGVLCLMIFPGRKFGTGVLNYLFYGGSVILLTVLILLLINMKRKGNEPLINVEQFKKNLPGYLASICFAGAFWYCYEYMNGLYEIHHDYAERRMLIWFFLGLICTFAKKELLRIRNLIYVVIAGVGVFFHIKPHRGLGEEEDIYKLQGYIIIIGGLFLLLLISSLISAIRNKKIGNKKICLPYILFFALLLGLMIAFRNGRQWVVVLIVIFVLFYLRMWLWDNSKQILTILSNAIVFNFLYMVIFSLLHRPYHKYIFFRYGLGYHTVTTTAVYLSLVMSVLYAKAFLKYRDTHSVVSSWPELILLGIGNVYLLLTLSRNGILTVIITALFLIILLICMDKGKTWKMLVRYIAISVISLCLMFPIVFTATRIMPAIANDPILSEIEEFGQHIEKGVPSDSERYMDIKHFYNVALYKLLGINKADFALLERDSLDEFKWNDLKYLVKEIQYRDDIYVVDDTVLLASNEEDIAGTDSLNNLSNGRIEIYRTYIDNWNMQGHEKMSVEAPNGESIVHAHNVYLQVIHDHGLITGIVFTLFGIISFILLLVRFIKTKNDKMIYSLAIVIAFAVSGVAEWNFHLCNAFGLSVFMALTPLLFQDKEAKLNER